MIEEEKFTPSLSPAANIFWLHNTPDPFSSRNRKVTSRLTLPPAAEANQTYLYELQQQQHSYFSLPKPDFQW